MALAFNPGGPEFSRSWSPPSSLPSQDLKLPREPRHYRTTILDLLRAPNIASKQYVVRQYDHDVRASTVLKPLQRVVRKAAHADASLSRPRIDSWRRRRR